ncbi:hypothetical protein N7414_19985 [Pseudomonas sp. GD04087]|uniref:hypothetical protein n=1 Tax=unclassified Pseudomonas TaxID=196821 RepID=UPI002449F664|nr:MULTISPECIES: hypothetical protein [unclassified Pseudomonas]MDH0291411.1 hypothetical protein [Pseudomonas sp. GD04087]MDH1051723.1 hypothetical protein [Pseudomonas sp. GD03903]MDH2001743.1 hypothetical protein [Pseudomonas sp. GD03691]
MARARNIKPSFFKNEDLADLESSDRLLFIGLWCLADREGRLEDRPRRIKIELFPGDGYDVETGLANLAGKGFIDRYEVDGYVVISLPNFLRHQSPHSTEKDSELPDCNGYLTVNERLRGKVIPGKQRYVHAATGFCIPANNSELTVKEPDQPATVTVGASTHNALIPDSLNPDYLNPEEEKEPLGVSGETPPAPANQPGEKLAKYSDDFESFWREYPKRHRASPKPDAWKAWQARIRAGVPSSDLIAAAIAYRKEQVALGKAGTQYVQQPATFLGPGERWVPYLGEQPTLPMRPGAKPSNFTNLPKHTPDSNSEEPDHDGPNF